MTQHNRSGSKSSMPRRSVRKKDTVAPHTRRRAVAGLRKTDTPANADVASDEPDVLRDASQEDEDREIARSEAPPQPRPTPSPRPRSDNHDTVRQAAKSGADEELEAQEVATSSEKRRWHPGRRTLVIVLAVLVVAAAGCTGYLAFRSGPPDVRPSVAEDGTYTPGSLPSEVGKAAVAAAVRKLPEVLSYDYRSLDQEMEAAKKHMTSSFAKTYQETYRGAVMPVASKKKAVTRALIRGAGPISTSGDTAQCLVYVNQMLVSANDEQEPGKDGKQGDQEPAPQKQGDAAQISQNRVIVTMKQQDGHWLIDGLQPF